MWLPKSLSLFIMCLALLAGLGSCDDSYDFNAPEGKIQTFLNQYYPGVATESKSTLPDGDIQVVLKGSATILFDSTGSWLSVDGNGVTLPSVMLYDQLPPKLYNYIEEMEDTEGVYRMSRNSTDYTVEFLDSIIQYVISTGDITYVTSQGD